MKLIRGHSTAFTLIEALLAAVVLAMVVAAVTMPFAAAASSEQEDARRTVAANLAQEMMEEILSKPFGDPDGASRPGPEPGETARSLYDNIDDYDGSHELPGRILSLGGAAADDPAAVGLSRHVTAEYVWLKGQDVSSDPTFVRVTVEVQYRSQPLVRLVRLAHAQR